MADEVEMTLCQLPQVHVFRIPARKSAEGYRASDWPKDPAWTGKLRVVGKGRVASIILYDDKNPAFAVCKVVDDSCVEKVLDSGRYFILKITNAQGRHAFIGIAFNERNDSFDFNVALSEFKSQVEREDQAAKNADVPVVAMKDMSLKEGEKIKIKITHKNKTDSVEDEYTSGFSATGTVNATGNSAGASRLTGALLPPPKKGGLLPPPPTSGGSGNNNKQQQPSQYTQQGAAADPFASSAFGSSDPFGDFISSSVSTAGPPVSAFQFTPSQSFPSTSSGSDFSSDPFASSFAPSTSPAVSKTTSTSVSQSVNLLDL